MSELEYKGGIKKTEREGGERSRRLMLIEQNIVSWLYSIMKDVQVISSIKLYIK